MKYREIRERAAELLERDGWEQGTDMPGKRCIIVALGDADEHDEEDAACEEIMHELGLRIRGEYEYGCSLIEWNDAPGRTLAEVLAALRGNP